MSFKKYFFDTGQNITIPIYQWQANVGQSLLIFVVTCVSLVVYLPLRISFSNQLLFPVIILMGFTCVSFSWTTSIFKSSTWAFWVLSISSLCFGLLIFWKQSCLWIFLTVSLWVSFNKSSGWIFSASLLCLWSAVGSYSLVLLFLAHHVAPHAYTHGDTHAHTRLQTLAVPPLMLRNYSNASLKLECGVHVDLYIIILLLCTLITHSTKDPCYNNRVQASQLRRSDTLRIFTAFPLFPTGHNEGELTSGAQWFQFQMG